MNSHKKIQSEHGLFGNVSPNLELINQIVNSTTDHFLHVHETITNDDAYLFIGSANIGHKKATPNEPVLAVGFCAGGCLHNIEYLMYRFLKANPEYLPGFLLAAGKALDETLKEAREELNNLLNEDPE